tara:strand:- start:764 stop:1168 length:405 start_codon:yes stop_codon:yes gene_type:complete
MMSTDHHHEPMTATITRVEAEGALADDVLQAARQVVDAYSAQHSVYSYGSEPWKGCGPKNLPLLTLLDQLIGAMEPVAAAIADNAWDDALPVPTASAKGLAEALHRIAGTITTAAAAPDAAGWSLPSCTGKELV